MKRIGLYLSCAPEHGGVFQYSQSILNAVLSLPADKYHVVVAFAHPEWSRILDAHAPACESFEVREGFAERVVRFLLGLGLPLRLWHSFASAIHPLARRLLRAECDIWLFPGQDVMTFSLPAPTIGVIHDLMHRHETRFPEVGAPGIVRIRESRNRSLCAHAKAILVDSDVGKHHVASAYGIDEGRIHVLPYIAPAYIRESRTPKKFDERYKLPSKFMFYPAQFWDHKNHLGLIHALAQIRDDCPDLHLVLAGSPKNAYERVMASIESLNLGERVHVLGYVPDEDMAMFYSRACALVMPTFFGPTNIPPLEALATRCPMAVSNIYAMPSQVGNAALLFDPGSVDEIANAMRRLSTDDVLRGELSAAAARIDGGWCQPQFNERVRQIIEAVV